MNPGPVAGLALEIPAHTVIEPHDHKRGQLQFACSGVMLVEVGAGTWVVPPQRAIWIPSGTRHRLIPLTNLSLRNLLVQRQPFQSFPDQCCSLRVNRLLRELIIRLTEAPELCVDAAHRDLIGRLILYELRNATDGPLYLPDPQDQRLRRICQALRENPADNRTLDEWADVAGASSRTFSRLFLKETGMSFAAWRRQARLMHALVLLGKGQSVTTVALDVGYDSPSAFIEVFKRELGQTPAQYFS